MAEETTIEKAAARIEEVRKTLHVVKFMESLSPGIKTGAERQNVEKLVEQAELLLKEAYMLGARGNPCPTCRGSGRV